MFKFNIIEKFKIIFNFKKGQKLSHGGDAGEVFIAARKIRGNGKITANGGSGKIGGRGGKVTVISDDNQFKGEISAKGGESKK
jgi:pectate lyase